jgi:predicted O-linked N-acetylglucosamine transferase (SPINDLY family)
MIHEVPAEAEALMRQGVGLHQEGRLREATELYRQALNHEPRHFRAWHLLGVVAFQTDQPKLALELFRQALRIDPQSPEAHHHQGNALLALGEIAPAISSYDRAIGLNVAYAEAYYDRGNAYFDIHRYEDAIGSYDKAVELKSDYVLAYNNRGLAMYCVERYDAAIADYDTALAIDPANAAAYTLRADALRESAQFQAAIASYDRAIELKSDQPQAHSGRGSALAAIEQYEAALDSYDHAVAIKTDFAEAYLNRGNVLKELGRWPAALESYDRAIRFKPAQAEAFYMRANLYRAMGRHDAALVDFDRAFALKPDIKFLRGLRRHSKMQLCDWEGFDADLADIVARLGTGAAVSPPFVTLALTGAAAVQRQAAEIWVREECPPDDSLPGQAPRERREKIRIGYFSADFRNHPVAYLTAEMFETHDRSRFEVMALSLTPGGDEMRGRLEAAFDRFIDVAGRPTRDIAALARSLDLDIAVDLGGFTDDGRPGMFALRAAPVQVGYLGYLGTMAAPYMDYLVADRVIVPPESQAHYSEKIIYLPSFQANDSRRRVAETTFSRDELGLPPGGFVFCCFNSNYKITPDLYASWVRILQRVPASVLFLYAGGAQVESNLRAQAQRLGLDPARLIFGGRLPVPEYLARYRAADLFLDTLPYNAGATASDALWTGLPVLTCAGEAFASRVGASLLSAIGLPELIASTLAQYEDVAVHLATHPEALADLRRRLDENRLTAPLFDTRRHARHMEAAFAAIHERHRSGLSPDHVFVA